MKQIETIDELTLNFELLKNSTILYLESDNEEKELCVPIFEKYFGKVLTCSKSEQAFKLYDEFKNQINLIIADVYLGSDLDGIAFMKDIRNRGDWDLPIVIITKLQETEILMQAITLKVADYIVKPMKINTTLKIMNNIIEERFNKKLVEKQSKELEQFKGILDKENMISETDLDGNITYVNDIFCDVTGYEPDEVVGKTHNILRHKDVSDNFYEELWQTVKAGKVWRGNIKNQAKDGSTYYVRATIFPIQDIDGNTVKYMASRFLITSLEEEKQTLRKYIFSVKGKQVEDKNLLSQEIGEKLKENYEIKFKEQQDKLKEYDEYITELKEELNRLRSVKTKNTQHINFLEDENKGLSAKLSDAHANFQINTKKLSELARKAVSKYEKIKRANTFMKNKYEKSQDNIKVLDEYIQEYRKKIEDLYDVIKAKENDVATLKDTIQEMKEKEQQHHQKGFMK